MDAGEEPVEGGRLPCEAVLRRPRSVLAALLLLTVALGLGVSRTRFDPSTERVFPEGHPAVATYQAFRQVFGSDEALFVACALDEGEVFQPEVLGLLRGLTRDLAALDGVERAFGLADVPVLVLGPAGFPVLAPGLPDDPTAASPERVAAWRRQVLATPFVERVLLSPDRRAAMVVALVRPLGSDLDGAQRSVALVDAASAILEQRARDWQGRARFHLAGSPVVKAAIMEAIQTDMIRFGGPLLLLATLTSYLVLRSLRAVAMVLGVLGCTTAWVLGALGHLGIPIDSLTSLVPSLILVIGVADALHLLVEIRAQRAERPAAPPVEVVRQALAHVLRPCLLTTLTTAIGFGSLVTSHIAPIRGFGLAAAAASLTAFAVTFTLVPALAALFPLAPRGSGGEAAIRTEGLADWLVGRPLLHLGLGAALTAVCLLGAGRITVSTDFLRYFKPDSRLRRDADAIEAGFAGVAPCEMLISGPPGLSRDPAALRAILAFQRDLERLDLVDLTFSPADWLVAAQRLLTGEADLPADREGVARLEGLLESLVGGVLPRERLISPAGDEHPGEEWLRVTVRARALGSARFGRLLEEVAELEARHLAALGLHVRPTGASVVFSQTADEILWGQVESFCWAMATITLVMMVALRSFVLGLISILPNLVPVAAIVGTMGLLGIELNSFNSMVASVAIGIAVDDTIHVLAGFQRFRRLMPRVAAVRETLAHEGAAVLATSVVLFFGFAVLLLASFLPTMHFGLLTAISLLAALVGDLLVLPALLLLLPLRCGDGGGASAG